LEQRLNIITLGVQDLQTASDFYTNQFGWKPLPEWSHDKVVFFQLNGLLLSLYPKEKLAEDATVDPAGSGFKGFSLAFNTRSEQEVDDLIAELGEKGVPIIKEPQKVFWGGYSGYIADPDGHLWEIAFNPFLALDKEGNPIL